MAISRKDKIDAAIKDIRHFHDVGRASCDSRAGRSRYGSEQLEREAKKKRLDPFMFRKARQFAREYSREDLTALCSLIRMKKRFKTVFGRTHLIRLLAVPLSMRGAWQKKTIQKGWSVARLNVEMATEFGRRRVGGKRSTILPDVYRVYSQIETRCRTWMRLQGDLSTVMTNMPKSIRDLIGAVTEAVRGLEAGVSSALVGKWSERKLASAREPAHATD